MDEDVFSVTCEDAVATVTLHGTAAGNALGGLVWSRLPDLMTGLEHDDGVRAVVLRGAGELFSAGLDLRWYLPHYRRLTRGQDAPRVRAGLLRDARRMQDAISAVARSPLPVIAAVHGPCVGAALDLAGACDIRLASREAYVSLREIRIGVVADLGSLQRLPRLIGAARTREMALTGRDVPAAEAHAMGLVSEVLAAPAELFERAADLARQIAAYPPGVVAGIKTTLDHTLDMPLETGLYHMALWNAAFLPSEEFPDRLREVLRAQVEGDR